MGRPEQICKMRLSLAFLLTCLAYLYSATPLSGKIYGKHFEGDIAIKNPEKFKRTGVLRAFVKNKELRWGKTIQYTIGPDLVEHSNTIRSCLDWISQRSCLVFIQGDTGDHIKFTSFGDDDNDGSGCWSYFGRRGGEQVVNLEIPSCLTKDTIFHEVFHALGKVHEQSRPDGDDHVDVLLQNVAEGQADQFEIKKNGDPTIQAKSGTGDFGQSEEPTETDLWELNHAYGCRQSEDNTASGTTEHPFYYYLSDYEDYEEYPNAYNDYQIGADNDTSDFPLVIDETGFGFSSLVDDTAEYVDDTAEYVDDTAEYEYE